MERKKNKEHPYEYTPWPTRVGNYTYKQTTNGNYILHAYLGDIEASGKYRLPKEVNGHPVSSFTSDFARMLNEISRLIIPADFGQMDNDEMANVLTSLRSVSEFIVDGDGPYKTIDGVLFYGTELIKYPPLRKGTKYVIPVGTTRISSAAFFGARNLISIDIPDTVEEIGEDAFGSCYNLSSLLIPESVKFMGISAFIDCTSLESVLFESCDTDFYIDGSDFIGCIALKSIYINPNNPIYFVRNGVIYMRPGYFSLMDKKHEREGYRLIYYPAAKEGDNYLIPYDVEYIESYAFISNQYLKKIYAHKLPDINKFSFGGSPFDISQIEILPWDSRFKNTPLGYIYPDTIITVADNFLCMSNGHHLKDKKAKIRMIDPYNHLVDIPIEIGYCIECSRYYMYSDFYKKDIGPLCDEGWKIIAAQFQLPNKKVVGYKIHRANGIMATESVLKLCGYTVGYNSGLTARERQSILKEIIEKGLLSRQEIMSYQNHFIEFNGKTPSKDMSKAIADWEEDLHNL